MLLGTVCSHFHIPIFNLCFSFYIFYFTHAKERGENVRFAYFAKNLLVYDAPNMEKDEKKERRRDYLVAKLKNFLPSVRNVQIMKDGDINRISGEGFVL